MVVTKTMGPFVPSPLVNWNQPNLKDDWRRFPKHVGLIFSNSLQGESSMEKCSYLLIWAGEIDKGIFSTFIIPKGSENSPTEYQKTFKQHVEPS